MKILFISPRLPIQRGDILGSGIPYWPLELITLATISLSIGDEVKALDLFSEEITNFETRPEYYLQGRSIKQSLEKNFIDIKDFEIVVLYAISFMSHRELLEINGRYATLFRQQKSGI